MKKKLLSALLALCLLVSLPACGSSKAQTQTDSQGAGTSSASGSSGYQTSGTVVEEVSALSDAFADGDYKDVSGETPDATITLSGSAGTLSDTTRGSSGSEVTITSKGIYRVTGSSDGVAIVINDSTESGNVYLVLDGVTMTNTDACIRVEACDKLVIQCVGDNSLTSTGLTGEEDGVIFARDDVTINGSGSLTVTSAVHGIVGKDDVKITGARVTIEADSIGIQANESVRIGGGTLSITSGHDGVQVENDALDGYFYLESGSVTIRAGYDGVDAAGAVTLAGGSLEITAGTDSSQSGSTSQKGVKAGGDICVGAAELTVTSTDDALHSAATVSVTDGTLTLSSGDDGIHADSVLSISGGSVTVTQSYEGLEAYEVNVSGGQISVTASDDGVNAAGGSDSSSSEKGPWGSASGTLTISGGTLYVNAQGDGLDSNGSLYVTGGTVIVEGPTNGGNGALDKGDGSGCVASITGGTVLAIGTADMAVNFDSGTQCSALVSLSGSAGTAITVSDGFRFTATKSFACVVYSSPALQQGSSCTITAGGSSATADFTSGLYYSNVSGMGGGMGGFSRP